MSVQPISRDERTTAVENASYRLAYSVMSFGLLAIVTYRGFVLQEASWDLLGLVILGGATATVYQGAGRVLSRRWIAATIVTLVVSGILAALLVRVLP
ncbi:MAG: hypothetical protein ACYCYF_07705 [Anaerolineae bacterium]